jgi:UrcA family protein
MKTLAILTALMLGTSAPALAQTTSVHVSYADLDLRTGAGVKTLHRRVSRALTYVCGDFAFPYVEEARAVAKCRAEAKKGVEPQLAEAMRRRGSEGDTRVASAR